MVAFEQQDVYLGHGHAFRALAQEVDGVAGPNLAFLHHAQVEARPAVGDDERRHGRVVHPQPELVAAHPGLAHLDNRAANPEAVADAHLLVAQPVDGEVLAELAHGESGAAEVLGPVPVGVELIDHDGALLAAMADEVGLLVPHKAEPAGPDPGGDGLLPDRGSNDTTAPLDVAGLADVDGPHFA